jgi:hypothetical protein
MTDTDEGDRRRDLSDPIDTRSSSPTGILPLIILAAVLTVIVFVMAHQRPATKRVGDTNAGPSVRTVTPAPSPSTSRPCLRRTRQPNSPIRHRLSEGPGVQDET